MTGAVPLCAEVFFQQLIRDAFFRMYLDNHGGARYYKLTAGILAGGPLACQWFNGAFQNVLLPWIEELKKLNPDLVTQDMFSENELYLGTSLFVDDISNKSFVNGSKLSDIKQLLTIRQDTHASLTRCLDNAGAAHSPLAQVVGSPVLRLQLLAASAMQGTWVLMCVIVLILVQRSAIESIMLTKTGTCAGPYGPLAPHGPLNVYFFRRWYVWLCIRL